MELEHVLVVGAGQMGAGIAQVLAASGRAVSLHDPYPGATERGLAAIEQSLTKLAEKGGSDPTEILARIAPVDRLAAEADLLVEAIVEDAGAKEELFRRADEALPPHAILASNTSSIPITSLAAVTGRPAQVIGMHFFNPVAVLKLVEVIRGVETSDETAAAIVALAGELGKEPAESRDFPGFVSNRILIKGLSFPRAGGRPVLGHPACRCLNGHLGSSAAATPRPATPLLVRRPRPVTSSSASP